MLTTALLACLAGVVAARTPQTNAAMGWQYVSPLPGSRFVSPGNNIAIRQGSAIDPATVGSALLAVVGSKSGAHAGVTHLSDDGQTIVFEPSSPYALGETVTVSLKPGVRILGGPSLPRLAFDFVVATRDPAPSAPLTSSPEFDEPTGVVPGAWPTPARNPMPSAADVPAGFPAIVTMASDSPEPGCVFVTPKTNSLPAPLLIVDNLAMPIFYRGKSTDFVDFKKQNGLLTYFDLARSKWYALNSLYAVVDSFAAGNGYYADLHDMQLLPNGHALLLIYDTQPVGMDTVVAEGDPDALVYGLVVQELDASKNVVFQWRSWDHFEITDAVGVDLTAPRIDYVHGNAVERDTDGNLMISSRHLNEITKINRQTGAIIWRWGRNAVHNDFTSVGDARGFSHQHDIRRAPNGHVTLFDNGNGLNPEYSRALEYVLDEQNKVATLVREVLPAGGGFSHSSGSVQIRSSGGTMIGWGAGSIVPALTDLHADGTKALEFQFPTYGMTTYRAYRFDWQGTLIATNRDTLDFGAYQTGDTITKSLTVTNNGSVDRAITSFVSTNTANFSVATPVPLTVPHGQSVQVAVRFHPPVLGAENGVLYVLSGGANEFVARAVQVKGVGAILVDVPRPPASSIASLGQSRPDPARGGVTIPFSIARPGVVTLKVYDLSGRVVATLLDGTETAGDHVARWDGTRNHGGSASPGAYFYELRTSGERLHRRLILLQE